MTKVALGWRNSSSQAALAFLPPEPLGTSHAAGIFPGAESHAGLGERVFVLLCPFSVRIRLVISEGRPVGFNRVDEPGSLSEEGFRGLVSPITPAAQRDGRVPACQISMNILFISDVDCVLTLLPPVFSPGFREWPGSIVCGQFPLAAWPRPLNCVLEWTDWERDWVLRRGDPLALVMPIYPDPETIPDLFEARLTPELRRHLARMDTVSDYGRDVSPMIERARHARPARLVERKLSA